jgi:hypothetical protein
MAMKVPESIDIGDYLGHHTLITGDVNSGKTRLTLAIIEAFCKKGHAGDITILDLAPDLVNGIGGQLALPPSRDLLVLTCPVIPPRLTAKNEAQVDTLARRNAAAIDPLIDCALDARRPILFVNDASLYLQAGRPERLFALASAHATVVLNAYIGKKFLPTAFSQKEMQLVRNLSGHCNHVIRL